MQSNLPSTSAPGSRVCTALAQVPYLGRSKFLSWYRRTSIEEIVSDKQRCALREIRPAYNAQHRLPLNIKSVSELPEPSKESASDGSFRGIFNATVDRSFLAEIKNCWLIRNRYEWGESSFCICTEEGQPIQFHGLVSDVSNGKMQRAYLRALRGNVQRLEKATWVLGYWYENYYHWFVEWLPRLVLALENGLPDNTILMPNLRSKWNSDSIAMLGIQPQWLPTDSDAWRIGTMTLVCESPLHGPALDAAAKRLLDSCDISQSQRKKIWISRRNAVHRRLDQEGEIEEWLVTRGWEVVQMEKLNLREQIMVMRNAIAVGGVHGAGLTNLLFTPPSASLFEIVSSDRPTPLYYGLACALNRAYSCAFAKRAGRDESIIHDDMIVDVESVKKAIEGMETSMSIDLG